MHLLDLTLSNFRNYGEAALTFGEFNLFIGANAQGKTALLEAILFLATTKSHRTNADDELIRYGADCFYLGGTVEDAITRRRVEVSNVSGGKKQVKLDGKAQTRLSALIGQMKVVLFAPESLTLVKDGPSERRRFLDILLSQVRPEYLRVLQTYQSALRQRNELLKQIRERHAPTSDLEIWDAPLVESGVRLTRLRAEACEALRPILRRQQAYLTRDAEQADLQYLPDVPIHSEEATMAGAFSEQLVVCLTGDIARGSTSAGPHRDDIRFAIGGADARRFGSQGQQRTLTLAAKLAELEWIRCVCGETPLFLLDDVTSELDETRTALLFEALHELPPQIFLTTTRLQPFLYESFHPVVFEVVAGTAHQPASPSRSFSSRSPTRGEDDRPNREGESAVP